MASLSLSRFYTPLGGYESKSSDFRLITATNRQTNQLNQKLDPDFLDRISYLTLTMPSLRDIPEELEWLWPKVFQEASRRASIHEQITTPPHSQIIQLLQSSPLEGNLRSLYQAAYLWIVTSLWHKGDDEKGMESLEKKLQEQQLSMNKSISHDVAQAYLANNPLDSIIARHVKLETKKISDQINAYLARELKNSAKRTGKKLEDLCDVTPRTLDKWLQKSYSDEAD